MTQVWMYVVASSSDPDFVRCKVPWRVDEDLIFFGPCKKRLRTRLRNGFLRQGTNYRETSGCGKTTLLNAIAGFHDITAGEIYLDGALLCSGKKMADPGADRIVVFQHGALFPWYTVMENVIYGPVVQGQLSTPQARIAGQELLNRMGLMGMPSSRLSTFLCVGLNGFHPPTPLPSFSAPSGA